MRKRPLFLIIIFILALSALFFVYSSPPDGLVSNTGHIDEPVPPYVPPAQIKAIYATSDSIFNRTDYLTKLLNETELNAIVININDARLDWAKLRPIVRRLNAAKIHTIARIVVLQNPLLVMDFPEVAIKNRSGQPWRDTGGNLWADPAHHKVWEETLNLSRLAAKEGFREINYDYIRFPSEGNLNQAVFPAWDRQTPKSQVINELAKFLRDNLKKEFPELTLSIDIFAHIILIKDDAGIGQQFTEIVDYFDATAPMIYPSHYRPGHFGFNNPASHPYEVVKGTLKLAAEKLTKANKKAVLRPWLQDFKIGAAYDTKMIKDEIKAVSDAGYDAGWMLWNARNVYSASALGR